MASAGKKYVLPSSDYDAELKNYIKEYSDPGKIGQSKLENVNMSSSFTMVAIGDMYYSEGKLNTALNSYTTALNLMIKGAGEKHIVVSSVQSKIASIYNELQNYSLAIKTHEQVLAIVESWLGKDHLLAAKVRETIALVQFKNRSYGLSLENFKRALETNIENLGMCHPQVASTLNNLGNLYFTRGQLPLALIKYSSALEIMKLDANLYADSAARTLLNIGNIYEENGDLEDSVDFFQAAIDSAKCGSKEKVVIDACQYHLKELATKIRKAKEEAAVIRTPMEARVPTRVSKKQDASLPPQRTFKFKTTLSDVLPRSLSSMKIHDIQNGNQREFKNLRMDKEALKIDQEIKDIKKEKKMSRRSRKGSNGRTLYVI